MASLYFLTMDEGPIGHLQQVEAACQAGIRWIQLRMKQADDDEVRETALAAKKICDDRDCVLIINDRVEIAAEVKAHGVHLGKQDMSVRVARRRLGDGFIIGGTANTLEDIREHFRQSADYIGLGPYRYTTTKKNLSPVLGLEGYLSIMSRLRKEGIPIPVVAIGGIRMEDAAPLLEAGLQGIAFSGLLVHAGDRQAMVRSLEEEIAKSLLC
ncbi:MAG TPA: thiamine phosphate synthase [Puia sp.]|jgi:thiamine-phosphate pyrophosphorylase